MRRLRQSSRHVTPRPTSWACPALAGSRSPGGRMVLRHLLCGQPGAGACPSLRTGASPNGSRTNRRASVEQESGDSCRGVERPVGNHAGSFPCPRAGSGCPERRTRQRGHGKIASPAAINQHPDFRIQGGIHRRGESHEGDTRSSPLAGGVLRSDRSRRGRMVVHRAIYIGQPAALDCDPPVGVGRVIAPARFRTT